MQAKWANAREKSIRAQAETPVAPTDLNPDQADQSPHHPIGSRVIAGALKAPRNLFRINMQRPDERSIFFALAAGVGYFVLASLGLELWSIHPTLASVWVPNAAIVSLLLLTRLRNEIPALAAVFVAAFGAHYGAGSSLTTTAILASAHIVDVVIVTSLIRRSSDDEARKAQLTGLSPILQFGGLVGPLCFVAIAAIALAPDWSTLAFWLMADSMGMILIVPAAMVASQAWKSRPRVPATVMFERTFLLGAGLVWTFFVFEQNLYALLFLVPPVTLLVAFRMGPVGAALFVPALALVAAVMTYRGIGPIALMASDIKVQTYLLQSFFATNFLTGLPIAAILAGRAQMTSELTNKSRELALLTESITDAVLWIDRDHLCTYASPSAESVLGLSPSNLVGSRVTDLLSTDSQDRVAIVLDRLFFEDSDKERVTYRRSIDDENGSPVFIEADCAVVISPEDQSRSGIVISARDVTERVELEMELTRARGNAEDAAHAKSEFLANMSHEIRTPMNGMLGFAELMLQGDLNEQNRYHTEMIVQSGRSMMLLLNDILDLSKIEAGEIVIDREPVDLFGTIEECTALHRTTAEKKGLFLQFSGTASPLGALDEEDAVTTVANSDRPWAMTDGLRLRQIVLNLVGNALKFTEEGGVEVQFEADAERFTIAVKDTGIGISPRRQETIFAPFTQGESDTARRFGGTGLGLTISRQLAELLGGTLTVESEPGVGSTFRLSLPATFIEPREVERTIAPVIEPADLPQSARVLLVEDHDVNRLLGVEMLERCGQSVAVAHDGHEAIAMVIDSVMRGDPYDLILMDIQMPGCDGYAATRAIRADGIGPDQIPIVALTANAFPEDIAAARDAGMQAHLAKPLVFADLARALQRWLPTRIVEHEAEPLDVGPGARLNEADLGSSGDTAPSRADDHVFKTGILDKAVIQGDAMSHSMQRLGEPASRAPIIPPQSHSPALLDRWNERRCEAIEAVRNALESGDLVDDSAREDAHETLARLVHKLAGTAATFGEPELGDQAAALEHAIRMRLSADVREALAFELLSVADDPTSAAPIASS